MSESAIHCPRADVRVGHSLSSCRCPSRPFIVLVEPVGDDPRSRPLRRSPRGRGGWAGAWAAAWRRPGPCRGRDRRRLAASGSARDGARIRISQARDAGAARRSGRRGRAPLCRCRHELQRQSCSSSSAFIASSGGPDQCAKSSRSTASPALRGEDPVIFVKSDSEASSSNLGVVSAGDGLELPSA